MRAQLSSLTELLAVENTSGEVGLYHVRFSGIPPTDRHDRHSTEIARVILSRRPSLAGTGHEISTVSLADTYNTDLASEQ